MTRILETPELDAAAEHLKRVFSAGKGRYDVHASVAVTLLLGTVFIVALLVRPG